MKINRLNGLSALNYAFIAPRNCPPTSRGLAAASQAPEISSDNSKRNFNDHHFDGTGVLLCQYINNLGDVYDVNPSMPRQNSNISFPVSGLSQLALGRSDRYKLQQAAYVAKIRGMLTPRSLSEGLNEFDSTQDNPPNSQSARFGTKPDSNVYNYRLVSWGDAGAGIPLMNNPYSVRPQNAPPVDSGFKRKKFTDTQREAVQSAQYRLVSQKNLKTGLHNSHVLSSRFLGPETNANIAPATFTNYKDKTWGQGEMQSHLENALFRLEAKASQNGIQIFLRCTDYLGKFGELQSRKIKIFLSEPVTDKKIQSDRGTVKETTLGTFYLPGMIKERENSDLILEFKRQVVHLERAIELVVSGNTGDESSRPPFEMRHKYGICAQDLMPLSQQKLMYGKIHKSNDGLSPVLQRTTKNRPIQNRNQETRSRGSLFASHPIKSKVLSRLNEIKGNPSVLKRGEEVWKMNEVETVLDHIRRLNLDDHIQEQIDSGQLNLEEARSSHSLGLSHLSSDASFSSLDTGSDEENETERTVELEFGPIEPAMQGW